MIPKFRAWLKNDKEMIDVDEIHFDNGQLDFIGDAITFMRKANEIELMQSTGLSDKNGKEIFEGDVVHAYSEGASLIGVVEYLDNAYCIKSKNDIYNPLWTNAEHYEVIGNIYENKELLEVGD